MPSNKKRLYVALLPQRRSWKRRTKVRGLVRLIPPCELTLLPGYHWASLVGPKNEKAGSTPGARYHVKNSPSSWMYEEHTLGNVQMTSQLLGRIVITKIEDEERLVNILRTLPVVQNDPNWRCRTWLASALRALAQDGRAVGTSELDWQKIEASARNYVREKMAGGRYAGTVDLMAPRPTYSLLTNEEILQ